MVLQELGFGDVASDIFNMYANPDGETVSYLRMLEGINKKSHTSAIRSFLLALAADSRIVVDTSDFYFEGDDTESARVNLAAMLERKGVRLTDVFSQLDGDGSGQLTMDEFKEVSRSASAPMESLSSSTACARAVYCVPSPVTVPAHTTFVEAPHS